MTFYSRAILAILPLAGSLFCVGSVSAQIVPHAKTSTIVDTVDGYHNISGGRVSSDGDNLFHSFEQFDLDAGETAGFATSADIKTVIGSVESTSASTIDGTLEIYGSDANLYLMNPAGILLGPQARLNLSGGVVVTTADGLSFDRRQFAVARSNDYSSFVGEPTALQFTREQAGAVVNLGNLQVGSGQSISLVGSAVANLGNLEAPDGTVSVVAVEGGNLVRLSQKERLLSWEVVADEAVARPSYSPASISEMLTGSSRLSEVTALAVDADGTVRLVSTDESISENAGSASVLGLLSAAGESGGKVEVLGKYLSVESANLDASGRSADGLIKLGAEDIIVTDEVRATRDLGSTYLSSGYVENLSTKGDVDIAASNDFIIEALSDGKLLFERGTSVTLTADSDRDLAGSFSMLERSNWIDSDRGDIAISGAGITAGVVTTDTSGAQPNGGGSITIKSSGNIALSSVSSNTYFGSSGAGDGGNVVIEATSGDITVQDIIKTWSYSHGGNNSGAGGYIDLRASGDVTVGDLSSLSYASKNSSGDGGWISIVSSAGDVAVLGNIDSSSRAGKNNAGAGGDVRIVAAGDIDVSGSINTLSSARNSNTRKAGDVLLAAGYDISVGDIDATSSGKGEDGNISLLINRIDLRNTDLSIPEVEVVEEPQVLAAEKSQALETHQEVVGSFEESVPMDLNLLSGSTQRILTTAIDSANESSESDSVEADMTLSLRARTEEELAIADTFSQIELGVGKNFREYLGGAGEDGKAATLDDVQKRLREIESSTAVTPSLVYAYFVPDAESKSAVVAGDRAPQANDQLEIMLITPTGKSVLKRQWGVTREQVEAASRTLRQQVTSQFSTPRQYLAPARQLYDWIVRPIAQELEEQDVDSLGFVMDDGLRMLPIAALYDGDSYLVENYSVGLLPSFSLTEFGNEDTRGLDLKTAKVLAMGASEFASQPSLPAVRAELEIITQQLWQGDAFLNEDFVLDNLQGRLEQQDYGIVHLATHASFESDNLENSYIQMWDDKLALSDMEAIGLDSSDVSLIILSACSTAMGDRASEYGFAGFAVTAGSETALASLWPVSDEGTLGFMSQFYSGLQQSSIKAEALRQAQLSMIGGEVGVDDGLVYGPKKEAIARLDNLAESGRWDFSHPFYWSAFTMIGNPW